MRNNQSGKTSMAMRLLACAAPLTLLVPTMAAAQDDAPTAHALVEAMSTAHGGYQNWLSAPSYSYTAVMNFLPLPVGNDRHYGDNWRYYSVTIDPDTSRGYVDIPLENKAGYEAGYDGENLWRTDYSFDPKFQDGPALLLWFHYGMASLPFVANVEGTKLEDREQETLPDTDTNYDVVRMTFAPKGKVRAGFIDIFIDPQTHLLKAWRQGSGYPLMPHDPLGDITGTPQQTMLRIINDYQKVDGFTVPRSYVSMATSGDIVGVHMLLEASFSKAFDEKDAMAPKGATIIGAAN